MAFMGLIGCGNLGSSMLRRWIENGADKSLIMVVDNHPERIQDLGFKTSELSDLSKVDVLVLAVKPWNITEVLAGVQLEPGTVVVSMAAGVNLARLEAQLPAQQPVCRVMPNIGVKLGMGVLALACNDHVQNSHKKSVIEILEPLGKTIELKEKDFNAVTALAGSGPAFVSLMLESMVMGGIAGGLSCEISRQLTLDTVNATVELIRSGLSFEQIRFLVCSPAGTTVAGLEVLENHGTRGSIIETLRVASERAHQLGIESEE